MSTQHYLYDKERRTLIPAHPGYYWARHLTPAAGTHEADLVQWPHLGWEIVQVNDNNVEDPADDEYLSVSVPGIRETQWRENFQWGEFVAPLAKDDDDARYRARTSRTIPVTTLKWWRELVDLNPRDLAPRLDALIAEDHQ